MTITPEILEELRLLALATKSEHRWESVVGWSDCVDHVVVNNDSSDDWNKTVVAGEYGIVEREDADFIARADPLTILALLDYIDTIRKEN